MANLNLSEFTEKLFVADADHTFIWDSAVSISKRVSRNSWLSGTTADFHLGLADAASPVAQTISVQSVVAGTSNTAGANFSINGSQGTGTGAGGALLLRTAPAGSSGTAQNALVTAVAITSAGNVGIGTTAPSEKLHVLGGKILVGDPTDITGASVNGELTVQAWRAPQLNIVCNQSSSNFFGLNIKVATTTLAGLLVNSQSGEVKIGGLSAGGYFPTFYSNNAEIMRFSTGGNVGIGTTSPTSKLHVAGSSSPGIAIENGVATGYSELLFKNTVVTGSSIFLNGSAQSGYGGNNSLNIYSSNGPLAFHTASVTNALSIAQSGAATFSSSLSVGSWVDCTELRVDGSEVFNTSGATLLVGTGGFSGLNLGAGNVIIRIGGTTNLFPALKRSATTIQARLANDSDFAPIQGKLTTETAFTATTVTPTGFITLYDSTGTAYKVPCVPA